MSNEEILCVQNLSKKFYIHERDRQIDAFQDVSFSVHGGELVALVGASGAGKSSILKCIYRTYLPSAGTVFYHACGGLTVDLASANNLTILKLRRNEIRFVSQFLRILPRRSALQLVETTLRESNSAVDDRRDIAIDYLRRVGLPESLWHLSPGTFSGGERQLVNLAQALAVQPRLLLLDEPTASLDPRATQQVIEVIQSLKSNRLAIVGVFHDRRIIAQLADRAVELSGGLLSQTPPGELV